MNLYSNGRRSVLQALMFAFCCFSLLREDFDVLEADHMPYWHLFPLWAIARVRHKRFVITWHEAWGSDYWTTYLGRPGVLGWWIERLAMTLPDAVIAASPHTAERLRAWIDPGRIFVAPNGIDLAAVSRVVPSPDAVDVVSVGRLISHKRVDLLIDAIAELRSRGEQVSCRVIGNGPELSSLLGQIERLGLSEHVKLVQNADSQDDVYSELKGARVFAFPSEREGFGIAALEALACGLPVVTTSAPDNMARYLVAQSSRGMVCEASAMGLADAIHASLSSRPLSSPEIEPWLRDFDWEVVAGTVAATLITTDA